MSTTGLQICKTSSGYDDYTTVEITGIDENKVVAKGLIDEVLTDSISGAGLM